MSTVTVRLFAAIAEAVGRDEVSLPAATVGDVVDALVLAGWLVVCFLISARWFRWE